MQPAAGVFLHVVGVCSPAQRAFPRFLRIISPTSLKTLFGTVVNRYVENVLVLSILYDSGERVNWGNPRSLYNHTLLETPLLPSLKAYILKVSRLFLPALAGESSFSLFSFPPLLHSFTPPHLHSFPE